MSFVVERTCPLCGATASDSPREVVASLPAETLEAEELRDYFVGFRKGQCFFTYFRCQCGLLWCPTYFTPEALDTLYESMPENTAVSGERDSRRTQQGYAEILAGMIKVPKSVLELGADIGLLMGELKVSWPYAQMVAVEPNRSVHPELQQVLSTSGRIFRDLDEVPPTSRIDLAVAIHVMDHVLDPVAVLRSVAQRADEEYGVFVVVHDESSGLRRLLGRRWAPFCLQHPQLYRPETIGRLFHAAGIRTVALRKTANWMSPRQAGLLLSSIGLAPEPLARILPELSVPVRLGNIGLYGQSSTTTA